MTRRATIPQWVWLGLASHQRELYSRAINQRRRSADLRHTVPLRQWHRMMLWRSAWVRQIAVAAVTAAVKAPH